MSGTPDSRPLSPHIQIYRWEINMLSSILHRATGIALAVGTVLVTAWLFAIAAGREEYAVMYDIVASPVGQVMLFGWTFALYFHMFSGLRHFAYDLGKLYPLKSANAAAYAALGLTLLATIATWLVVCFG